MVRWWGVFGSGDGSQWGGEWEAGIGGIGYGDGMGMGKGFEGDFLESGKLDGFVGMGEV
jgi:hypothetical protein